MLLGGQTPCKLTNKAGVCCCQLRLSAVSAVLPPPPWPQTCLGPIEHELLSALHIHLDQRDTCEVVPVQRHGLHLLTPGTKAHAPWLNSRCGTDSRQCGSTDNHLLPANVTEQTEHWSPMWLECSPELLNPITNPVQRPSYSIKTGQCLLLQLHCNVLSQIFIIP